MDDLDDSIELERVDSTGALRRQPSGPMVSLPDGIGGSLPHPAQRPVSRANSQVDLQDVLDGDSPGAPSPRTSLLQHSRQSSGAGPEDVPADMQRSQTSRSSIRTSASEPAFRLRPSVVQRKFKRSDTPHSQRGKTSKLKRSRTMSAKMHAPMTPNVERLRRDLTQHRQNSVFAAEQSLVVVRDEEEQERQGLRRKFSLLDIIPHNSTFKRTWDIVIGIMIIYTLIIIPLEMSLDPFDATTYIAMDIALTLGFATHILITFRTEVELRHRVVTDPKEIATLYLRKWFWLDLLATIPWDLIFSNLLGRESGILTISRLVRLVRVARLFSTEKFSMSYSKTAFRMVNMIATALITAHWLGCMWYLLSDSEGFCNTDEATGDAANDTVSTALSCDQGIAASRYLSEQTMSFRYLQVLHWGIRALISMGSELSPTTSLQTWLCLAVIFAGVFTFSVIIGNMEILLSQSAASSIRFQEHISSLNDFCKHNRLSRRLHEMAMSHTHHWYRVHRGHNESQLLACVPTEIRKKIYRTMYKHALRKCAFFEKCDDSFIDALCEVVYPQVALVGDIIIRQGAMGQEMFIIEEGCAEAVDLVTQEVHATIPQGSFFGEIALFTTLKRTISVRAKTFMKLFVLEKKYFLKLLKMWPDEKKMFAMVAKERMKNTKQISRMFRRTSLPSAVLPAVSDRDEKSHADDAAAESPRRSNLSAPTSPLVAQGQLNIIVDDEEEKGAERTGDPDDSPLQLGRADLPMWDLKEVEQMLVENNLDQAFDVDHVARFIAAFDTNGDGHLDDDEKSRIIKYLKAKAERLQAVNAAMADPPSALADASALFGDEHSDELEIPSSEDELQDDRHNEYDNRSEASTRSGLDGVSSPVLISQLSSTSVQSLPDSPYGASPASDMHNGLDHKHLEEHGGVDRGNSNNGQPSRVAQDSYQARTRQLQELQQLDNSIPRDQADGSVAVCLLQILTRSSALDSWSTTIARAQEMIDSGVRWQGQLAVPQKGQGLSRSPRGSTTTVARGGKISAAVPPSPPAAAATPPDTFTALSPDNNNPSSSLAVAEQLAAALPSLASGAAASSSSSSSSSSSTPSSSSSSASSALPPNAPSSFSSSSSMSSSLSSSLPSPTNPNPLAASTPSVSSSTPLVVPQAASSSPGKPPGAGAGRTPHGQDDALRIQLSDVTPSLEPVKPTQRNGTAQGGQPPTNDNEQDAARSSIVEMGDLF